MPFKEGHTKQGGRKKGTPNKNTERIRNAFASLLEDNLSTIEEDIKELKPAQRTKFFIDLAKYVVPQLKQMEYKSEDGETIPIPVIKFTSSDSSK